MKKFKAELENELGYKELNQFCLECDKVFLDYLERHYSHFHTIGEGLVDEDAWIKMYEEMETT